MNDNFDLAAMRRMATLITPFAGQAILQCCDEIERWQARASLAQPASVPHPGSPEASAMIDSELAAHGWPSNTKNAARAGYKACSKLLAAAPQAPQPAQAKSRQQEIINSIKSALIRHEAATDAVIATAAGDDPHAATLAGIELEKAAALLATWTQPEYLRILLATAPAQPAQAAEAAAPEPAADPGTTIDDGARIFARVMEYGGKERRQVVNPCITARECIALANYIAASDRTHYSQGKPQGEEPVGRIMRSAQTLALAVHFKQPKEAQDRARENLRAVVLDAMASAPSLAVAAPQPEAQPAPFKTETWPVDADGSAAQLCTECGKPVRYGSRHSSCGHAKMRAEQNAAPSAQAEPRKPNYRAECWPESPHNKQAEQGGK